MTKNLMTLLTSSENDEEVNISQSVRDLNSNLFDAIENEILTIENQEAGHEEELDTASQGMHDAVEASTEAEASRGEKMDNIHPGVDEVVEAAAEAEASRGEKLDNIHPGVDEVVEAAAEAEASRGEKMDNIHPGVDEVVEASTEAGASAETETLAEAGASTKEVVPAEVEASMVEEETSRAGAKVTAVENVMFDSSVKSTEVAQNSVTHGTVEKEKIHADTVSPMDSQQIAVQKSPMVMVQCNEQITTGGGGVVIDMGARKKSPKATEFHQDHFPSASTSPPTSQYQRALFTESKQAKLHAQAQEIVEEVVKNAESMDDDDFSDDEDDIPENKISNMTQKEKEKPEGPISSQLEEDAALDEINKPTYEDISDAEENCRDEAEESGGNGSGGDEEEEAEEVTAVRGLQQSMERDDVDEGIEPVVAASAPRVQYYTSLFASDDEGDVNLRKKGTGPPLKLGPVNGTKLNQSRPINGFKLSELRGKPAVDSDESSKRVTKSVYTPTDPLLPDPNHKKQSVLTDQFAKVVGTKPTNQPSSSSLQRETVVENASASGHSLQSAPQPTKSVSGKSAPIEPQSSGKATSSNSALRPISENSNVSCKPGPSVHQHTQQGSQSDVIPSSQPRSSTKENVNGNPASMLQQQSSAPRSTPSAHSVAKGGSPSSKNGNTKSPVKRKSTGAFKFAPPKMANIDTGSTSSELPLVKKAAAPIKKSKKLLTALPVRLGNKVCEFCFKPFLGRQKSPLTIREHINTGNCEFVKQNCSTIGVDRTCNQCPETFEYNKGMIQDIISHFCEENHEIICYICGLRFEFSEIFSHMSVEIAKFFEPGVTCIKCKSVLKSASSFYNHIKVYHSAKELNASVFNRFLYDSHPRYNYLLVSLMLTHSVEKV